jgi:uncharacterized protein
MDSALFLSALLMGLTGGPHCAAMCGAAHGAIARQGGAAQAGRALAAMQLGRLASYALAGALVAASVSWFATLGTAAPLLRPLWTMLHVAAIALGLWLLWAGHAPAWLGQWSRQATPAAGVQPLRFFPRVPAAPRAGLIGLCWAGIPCGLLQSALIVAALASGPWQGAGVMAGFALASSLSLYVVPRLWWRFGARSGALAGESVLPVRLAGGLLAGASLFALAHGLGSAIAQALCLPGA